MAQNFSWLEEVGHGLRQQRGRQRGDPGRIVSCSFETNVGQHDGLSQLCVAHSRVRDAQRSRQVQGDPGLAMKSHLLAPRSEPATSVVNFVLRHSGLERGGMSKDILPFPLSAFPTAAEISLSEEGRAHLGQAEGAEHIQEAGLEAWTFLVTWALNFVYSGRHGERAEHPETY